jgi:glucose-6-phosphate-specific signal transduction histidine kinase
VYEATHRAIGDLPRGRGVLGALIEKPQPLRLADDGKGFDPDTASQGFGLQGMRERVSLAGGTLTVSPSERGTLIRACLPTGASQDKPVQQAAG